MPQSRHGFIGQRIMMSKLPIMPRSAVEVLIKERIEDIKPYHLHESDVWWLLNLIYGEKETQE